MQSLQNCLANVLFNSSYSVPCIFRFGDFGKYLLILSMIARYQQERQYKIIQIHVVLWDIYFSNMPASSYCPFSCAKNDFVAQS